MITIDTIIHVDTLIKTDTIIKVDTIYTTTDKSGSILGNWLLSHALLKDSTGKFIYEAYYSLPSEPPYALMSFSTGYLKEYNYSSQGGILQTFNHSYSNGSISSYWNSCTYKILNDTLVLQYFVYEGTSRVTHTDKYLRYSGPVPLVEWSISKTINH